MTVLPQVSKEEERGTIRSELWVLAGRCHAEARSLRAHHVVGSMARRSSHTVFANSDGPHPPIADRKPAFGAHSGDEGSGCLVGEPEVIVCMGLRLRKLPKCPGLVAQAAKFGGPPGGCASGAVLQEDDVLGKLLRGRLVKRLPKEWETWRSPHSNAAAGLAQEAVPAEGCVIHRPLLRNGLHR